MAHITNNKQLVLVYLFNIFFFFSFIFETFSPELVRLFATREFPEGIPNNKNGVFLQSFEV